MNPETISYVAGIVVAVVTVAIAVVKTKKYKTILVETKDVLKFVAEKLDDGKLTGTEVVAIITKIVSKF